MPETLCLESAYVAFGKVFRRREAEKGSPLALLGRSLVTPVSHRLSDGMTVSNLLLASLSFAFLPHLSSLTCGFVNFGY